MTHLSPDEVYRLMLVATDPHAPQALEIPEGAKNGQERAQNEDIDEMFRGMRKHALAPALGLLSDMEVGSVPASFSIQQYCRPRESQGSVGSCTAWGTTGAIETKYFIATGKQINLSESYQWFRQNEQPNAWLSATTATKYWAVESSFWGYYAKEGKPGWENAKICAPQNPRELSNLDQMMIEISRKNPVMFSFSANFSNFARNGWVDPAKVQQNGAHEVYIVAYVSGDIRFPGNGYFVCANSWGPDAHGEAKGYFYVPFSYVTDGHFWVNFIAYGTDLLYKDGKVTPPNPPKPISYEVKTECQLIKTYQQDGHNYFRYDWQLSGAGVENVEKCEEVFRDRLGHSDKPVKAVDMKTEAKQYINTYADNANEWSPGFIRVTFSDKEVRQIPLTFPKKV